jgi:hypothetical protein
VFDYVQQREARTEPNAAAAAYTWRSGVGGTKENYDVTDAYLVAVYTWHQHLLSALLHDKQLRSAFRAAYRAVHSERLERADAAAAAAVEAAAATAAAAAQLSDKASKAKEKSLLAAYKAAQRKKLDKLYDDAVEGWIRDVLVPNTAATSSSSGSSSDSSSDSDSAADVDDDDAVQSIQAVDELQEVKVIKAVRAAKSAVLQQQELAKVV